MSFCPILKSEFEVMESATVLVKSELGFAFYSKRNMALELVWLHGIPPMIRGKVWARLVGNSLMITEELFGIFATYAQNARQVNSSDPEHKNPEPPCELCLCYCCCFQQEKIV